MKKITYIVISLLLLGSYSYAQGEVEANQFSRNDLYGTARALSMGGAFGALGGDLTGVSINPAGIAVYRSSEIATTAVFQNESFKAGDIKNHKNKFNFHNFGFVGYFPTQNVSIPVVNFGFSYNKIKSFDREIGAYGASRNTSLTDYMADISSRGIGVDPNTMDLKYDPWLSVLGFNSYLINDEYYLLDDNIADIPDNRGYNYSSLLGINETVNNSLSLSERGSIDVYDFTIGTSINNVLNLGVSLSLTDIYYNLYSENSEDFSIGTNAGFDLRNWLTSEGNGVGVKVGLIYRPVNALRFGLSYHSPTWYSMTDVYTSEINHNVTQYVDLTANPDYKPGYYPNNEDMENYRQDYNFKTPDKWTLSAAAVLSNSLILSLDYELTNYGSMKYSEKSGLVVSDEDSYDQNANSFIKSDFKTSSTVRAGLEYRFTPQFLGRLGYAWMQNPYDTTFKENANAVTVGATTAYRMEGDANYFTGGVGYRFNRNFYADLAVVYKTQDDDLYSYPNVYDDLGASFIDAAPYKLTNNSIRGVITLGYRF